MRSENRTKNSNIVQNRPSPHTFYPPFRHAGGKSIAKRCPPHCNCVRNSAKQYVFGVLATLVGRMHGQGGENTRPRRGELPAKVANAPPGRKRHTAGAKAAHHKAQCQCILCRIPFCFPANYYTVWDNCSIFAARLQTDKGVL